VESPASCPGPAAATSARGKLRELNGAGRYHVLAARGKPREWVWVPPRTSVTYENIDNTSVRYIISHLQCFRTQRLVYSHCWRPERESQETLHKTFGLAARTLKNELPLDSRSASRWRQLKFIANGDVQSRLVALVGVCVGRLHMRRLNLQDASRGDQERAKLNAIKELLYENLSAGLECLVGILTFHFRMTSTSSDSLKRRDVAFGAAMSTWAARVLLGIFFDGKFGFYK
jgi:hypothetical protein